jgi:hypothetical protein
VRQPGRQISLSDLAGLVLVAALALTPMSSGVHALGEASQMAAVGIIGVATAGALSRRSRSRAFRLGFALCGGVFLLVAGWCHTPGLSGRVDVSRVSESALAITIGILGGLSARRLTATTEKAEETV